MSAADLIANAKRRSSLDDFGEGDFSEALSRLVDSCQDEARLNLIGKIALKTDVLETLCARLQMESDRQFYPDITHQEIREPLFIVGLPRSGTSVLHRLLGADPEHRSPLMWEVRSPSPPTRDDEKRRQLLVSYRAGDMYAPQLDRREALNGVTAEFCQAIQERREPLTGAAAGTRVVRVLEAAERSLRNEGRRIQL